MALLLDNATYFTAVKAVLEQARRSILLIGWMFDPRTCLNPGDENPQSSVEIGSLLNTLARERPELDIRLLIWDAALPITASRHGFPQRGKGWLDDRIRFRLDGSHPVGACHHQKILVVDDMVAFCSGGDFSTERWDTSAHLDQDPRRRLPSGAIHEPRHGLTMMVEGAVAKALGDFGRERWRRATGEDPERPGQSPGTSPWPEYVAPLLTDVPVGIARTGPAWKHYPAVRENEALFLEAIAAAGNTLYIENQYFASSKIGAAIKARLAEPDGPEIVVVCSPRSPSLFDHVVMDAARDALVADLGAADPYGRFRAYAPQAPEGRGIILHSKVMIVDDRFLRVGSSNLNNRSMGLDTECDLAIEAGEAEQEAKTRAAIRSVRNCLVAHFLGCSEERFEEALADHGSLIAAIERLDGPTLRRLQPLQPSGAGMIGWLAARPHLGDPESAADTWRPWRRHKGPAQVPWLAVTAMAGAALIACWAIRSRAHPAIRRVRRCGGTSPWKASRGWPAAHRGP
ncbi:phospholipase D-like domain-containing protein [Skermanella mucosa]|uniref:phospholipase D-like domain-containing protein n=1 Tax=Skermanella mucosa TaxID=1789672 RepID=UPI00192C9A75|nr:phospholipase D-like domain-containing protein [Skermanella mucosa]UEM19800.1 phospholipase D-like domain-containing protein [Skermanella mucosa]